MNRRPRSQIIAAMVVASCMGIRTPAQESRETPPPALARGELESLLKQLESKEEDAVDRAFARLKDADAIVPNVARLLQVPNGTVQAWLAFELIRLGPSAKSAADPVLKRLEALAPDERGIDLVLQALGSIGAPPESIARSLKKAVHNKPRSQERSDFLAPRLFRHDPEGRWSVPVLAAVLESDEILSRHHAAADLGQHGSRGAPAADALLAAIASDFPATKEWRDPSASLIESSWAPKGSGLLRSDGAAGWSIAERSFLEYRSPYLWAISRMGPAGRQSLKRVVEIASTGPVALQPDAIRAAAMIDPDGGVAFKLAKSRLGDPIPFVRLGAEDAIRLLGSKASGARGELGKRWPEARPYELRPIARALEAVGWEHKPVVAELVSAIRKKKPDASSFAAAHRLGLVEQPEAVIIDALRDGLKSKEPGIVCLSALSLGRLAPRSESAAPELVAILKSIELEEEMNVWEAAKAAYAMEALGRLGPAASAALPTLTKMILAIDEKYWGILRVAGISDHVIAKTCWMIRPPSYALKASPTVDPAAKSNPPWSADWGADDSARGCVWWEHRASASVHLIEFGPVREMDADWSTIDSTASSIFMGSVLLTLTKDEKGTLSLQLLDWDRAVGWARQKDTETRPAELYALETRMRPIELDSAERIDLDFRVRELPAKGSPDYRWRGGFSIPNPFRRTGK